MSVLNTIIYAYGHLRPKCFYVKHSQLITQAPKGTFKVTPAALLGHQGKQLHL